MDSADALREVLRPVYTIERELGRGGMATVYLADDLKHGRTVALKALDPKLSASVGPARFRREIAIVAQLQHPHILPVFDSGETPAGQLWFTMPYVNGESLRDRLRRESQLPVRDALHIAGQVADALAYAHKHGVVHRDVKPENILLTADGDALLADFGVAWAEPTAVPGAAMNTDRGLAIGTPQYMSPEQAAGTRSLDARSDVFSLGCVLYEMLAGEPPFTGPNPQAITARRLSERHRPLRATRERIDPVIEHIVDTALAKAPADRFRDASEFAAAIDAAERNAVISGATVTSSRPPRRLPRGRVLVAVAALMLAAIGTWYVRVRAASPALVRMAVLPFDNIGDSANEYFADGLTDAVRAKLTSIPGLSVIGSSSSAHYRHTTKSPQLISTELGGVQYLLIGKIRWATAPGRPTRMQVTPELVDVATATAKWEEVFDAPITDVFTVQADIAGQVAHRLNVAITPRARQSIGARPTNNLDAYDAFLRGRDAERGGIGPVARRRAAAAYREAIKRDSGFALAWSGLAHAYALAFANGGNHPSDADSAKLCVDRVLALAPDIPESHEAAGIYYREVVGDLDQSRAAFREGLAIDSTNPTLLWQLGISERFASHFDSALALTERAVRFDPRSAYATLNLGVANLSMGRLPEAAEALDRSLAIEPTNATTIDYRLFAAQAVGDVRAVRAVIELTSLTGTEALVTAAKSFPWLLDSTQRQAVLALTPEAFDGDRGDWASALSSVYGLRGDVARSRAYADTALAALTAHLNEGVEDPNLPVDRALVLARLGRRREALDDVRHSLDRLSLSRDQFAESETNAKVARTYVVLADQERAIDHLERVRPIYMSHAWMRVDPTWTSLRGNARFDRLIAVPDTFGFLSF